MLRCVKILKSIYIQFHLISMFPFTQQSPYQSKSNYRHSVSMDKSGVQWSEAPVPSHVEKVHPAHFVAGSERHSEKTAAERTLLFKADCVILPICALTWWVTYLVRSLNIFGTSLLTFRRTAIPLAMQESWVCRPTSTCRLINSTTA
jgi:hypothetical protein